MAGSQRGRIIAFRADRLGARLVSLMNAMRIAQEVGAEFKCAWTETTGVGDVFNDPTELFDLSFVADRFLSSKEWATARPAAASLRPGAAGSKEENADTLRDGQDIIVGNAFGVITLTGEDLAEITPQFRDQLAKIPFSESVAAAMHEADQRLAGHTAYHIRRGDLTDDLKAMNKAWPHKMVPNEFYEIHMQEQLGDSAGVVLFSDDSETILHYQRAFPALKTFNDIIDAGGLSEAQRDLVELYAMARCTTIIAPERSAFSSTAADLFGAKKLSITEALGDDLTDQAHQALMERLENHPESFAGDGDIGQSLVHVGNWLEKQKRWADAARVFSNQVQAGLNISFVYPRTMTFQHHLGDLEGLHATSTAMEGRHVFHSKDLVNAKILQGYACIRGGDRKTGLSHIANGFWHDAGAGLAKNVVPALVELGWFNHTNFLPVTPLQRSIDLRRGPVKSIVKDLPGIKDLDGVTLPDAVGRLETAQWDWSPMLQSVSINAAVRTGATDRIMRILQGAKTGPELAVEIAGQFAILEAFKGETSSAKTKLASLSEENPDNWQIWQRLSHAHWIAREIRPALEAAERAVEVLPEAPLMHAWLGMIQMRARQTSAAIESLGIADDAETGLATITQLYAQALHNAGDAESALKAAQKARSLAPTEIRAAILEAKLLNKMGRPHDAAVGLQQLVEWQCATGKVFVELVELLRQIDESALAAEIAGLGSQRFPNHPGIGALAEELAA